MIETGWCHKKVNVLGPTKLCDELKRISLLAQHFSVPNISNTYTKIILAILSRPRNQVTSKSLIKHLNGSKSTISFLWSSSMFAFKSPGITNGWNNLLGFPQTNCLPTQFLHIRIPSIIVASILLVARQRKRSRMCNGQILQTNTFRACLFAKMISGIGLFVLILYH